ncbi:hypothetical protein RQP53_11980 [Paucibacter sp. APW11]|uniref:Uncharacterized protein n=1 Tax=Roseateles aquae TaxID=3077235 RepID=A0ABU3PBQ2_9BURK|nr:hypothetical protein [Paucibacter sp. APW11]MDT8999984.1 hypothetical protein [Paucibacter sp. APW11]
MSVVAALLWLPYGLSHMLAQGKRALQSTPLSGPQIEEQFEPSPRF